jgi:hypothetical protein
MAPSPGMNWTEDELRAETGDPGDECRYHLRFRPLFDTWSSDRQHFPVVLLPLGHDGADADDRVVDEFGELIAHLSAYLVVRFADEPFCEHHAVDKRAVGSIRLLLARR